MVYLINGKMADGMIYLKLTENQSETIIKEEMIKLNPRVRWNNT